MLKSMSAEEVLAWLEEKRPKIIFNKHVVIVRWYCDRKKLSSCGRTLEETVLAAAIAELKEI